MPLSPNHTLSHYSIIAKLGAGGMGEVYLAHDTKLDRKVALKILPSEFVNDKDRMGRFVREAKSASGLNHPSIITIYEIGESDGAHFIATEFIDGQTLNQYLKSHKQDLKSVLEIATQVASALEEAHSAGIVHRDIKPDNVMVRANGLAKILDFGIAKLSGQGLSGEAATAIKSGTSPGMIIGTANYMSPEQAKGKEVDARTDIFSFGVVLYEMVSARLPFEGETAMETIGAILRDEPKQLGATVPVELKRIVTKCLRKDREERYQSIKDVRSDLNELKQDLEFQKKLQLTLVPNEPATQFFSSRTTEEAKRSSQSRPQSIVVLPFANIGSDGNDDYFSDGLTEELISDLSKIRSLKVISRNSAMKLKGTEKDLRTIVKELDVRYVLDGSVRKAGTSLRISVQLIDGLSDANVWSEKYSGTMDDVFQMQESVSRSIVEALQLTLSTEERQQMEERPIADPQVYDLYLRARAAFNQGDPTALDRSIALLKQGIELIGDNELLYAALGYTHYSYFRWISKLDIDHLNLAEGYLRKTFALNPTSSHGFALKGLLSYSHGDIAEALTSLRKAVESDPANVEALLWLVVNQNYVGKCEESKQYAERLISIDPLTPLNIFISGFANIYSGEFDKSLPYLERALAIDSTSPLLLWSAIIIEAWCGRANEVYALVDKLAGIAPSWVYTQHALFLKHSMRGETELAFQHYTSDFDKEAKYDCHFALHLAHCFALLRAKEKALDFLETAVRAGMVNYPFLSRFDPLLENIRHEKRFDSLMIEAKRLYEEINSGSTNKPETDDENKTQILMPVATANQEAKPQTNSQTLSQTSKPKWWMFAVLGLIVLVGGIFGYRYFLSSSHEIESIAVMPFVNESGNQDVEYLSDGMTEMLIKSLANLPNLNVKPRSAVFRYKGKDVDSKTIARELNVQAMLNGRIVQRGDQLSVSLELVNAQKESVIWTEQYERKTSDLVSLQSEIARDVSTKLKSKLSGAEETQVTKIATADPAAYQAYLKGRYYWNRRTTENLKKAIEQFKIATDRDPNYALAFVGLADCYAVLNEYAGVPSSETIPLSRGYAERALTLDNQLAEPHATLGQINNQIWQYAESEREYKRAIELNPNYPTAYHWYSILLRDLGRNDETSKMINRAHELDPLSSVISVNVSRVYQLQNKHKASIENSLKLIELDPNFAPAHQYLGLSYLREGRSAEAITALKKAVELSGESSIALGDLAYVYATTGERDLAFTIIRRLEDKYARKEAIGQYIAPVYAGLGDKDKAFEWLEKDFQRRDGKLPEIRWQLQFESLRDDPRFKDLLQRMNLPE